MLSPKNIFFYVYATTELARTKQQIRVYKE